MDRVSSIAALATILLLSPENAGSAPVLLNDGAAHVLSDATHWRDAIRVRNDGCTVLHLDVFPACPAPGGPTDVTVAAGAVLARIDVTDSSSLQVTGGAIRGDLNAFGGATVAVTGGSVESTDVEFGGSTAVTVSGGTLAVGELAVDELASFSMSGGTLEAESMSSEGFAAMRISGGTLAVGYGPYVGDSSRLTIDGGTIGSDYLAVDGVATLTIVAGGSIAGGTPLDFTLDGAPVACGLIPGGRLVGPLPNGGSIDSRIYRFGNGSLVLSCTSVPPIPPTASLALFNDGGAHSIGDATNQSDLVGLRNAGCGGPGSLDDFRAECAAPGSPTTLDLTTGGLVAAIEVRDSSSLTISGGVVLDRAGAEDFSGISMTAGNVDSLGAGDLATVAMTGGNVGTLSADEFAAATVSGGSIDQGLVVEGGHPQILITGGTHFGSCTSGQFCALALFDRATVTLVGSFQIDGNPASGSVAQNSGTLSGTLFAGGVYFIRDDTAELILASVAPPAPTPPPTALLNDGLVHTASDATLQDTLVFVRDPGCGTPDAPWAECGAPGAPPTSFELASGGVVEHIVSAGSSDLSVTDGSAGGIEAGHSSALTISGGAVHGSIDLSDLVATTVSGGVIEGSLYADGFGTTALGGAALSVTGDVEVSEYHDLALTGGSVGGSLRTEGGAFALWSGGAVGTGIEASDRSVLRIAGDGSPFTVDGFAVPVGPLAATSGQLAGTLASGEPIDVAFARAADARILVPEPARGVLLAAGVVGVLGLRRRRGAGRRAR